MGGSRRIPWLVFLIGVLAVVDVLGWVTWRMVRLEHEQARTRAETARQEAIGRALWRMDSIVLPILAVESARPYFEYQAFYAANRPFDRMWEPVGDGDVLVPSPLLGEPGDFVQLHFERTADGRLTSPQAPPLGATRDAAIAAGVPPMLLSMADLRLYELDRLNAARFGRGAEDNRADRALTGEHVDAAWPGFAGGRDVAASVKPEDGAMLSATEDGAQNERRSIADPFGRSSGVPGEAVGDRAFAQGTDLQTRSLSPDELLDAHAAPPPVQGGVPADSRASPALADPALERESLEEPAGPVDPRQDLLARQQAANYAQTYNDAGRSNRTRQYETRAGGGDESAARPAAESQLAALESARRELSPASVPSPAEGGTAPGAASSTSTQISGSPTTAPPDAAGRVETPPAPDGDPRRSAAARSEPDSERARETNAPAAQTGTGTLIENQFRDAPDTTSALTVNPALDGSPSSIISNIGPQDETGNSASSVFRVEPGFWETSDGTLDWLDTAESGRRTTLAAASATRPDSGALTPSWRGDAGSPDPALVLTRTVHINGESREQGVWIDWPALRRALETSVSDLFPLAEVRPLDAAAGRGAMEPQRLATIPVVLIPGPLADGILPALPSFWTPTRWTLLVGWIAVAIAVVAIGIVLRKAIDLGERRGRFVSAVTHELRTPLTTFRLYSQMLAGGTITDEAKKTRYAQTLDRESQRLSGIVESVLEYARLGRRASGNGAARQRIEAAAVLDRVRPALAGRCERAGMELVMPEPAEVPGVAIIADPDKLERILLNLVDNACKYAAEAADRRILIAARAEGERLVLSVRDHGPGIPEPEGRRIFNAFHRAKHHDQSASPGLGLGLALSRGLAREMGGDLRLAEAAPGALFELAIPLA